MKHYFTSRRFWLWAALIVMAAGILVLSFFPPAVETWYTYGIYPFIAQTQRLLLGWIPFSVGDVFYAIIVVVLMWQMIRLFKNIRHLRFSGRTAMAFIKKLVFTGLVVFVVFYGFWGLNYSRVGIAGQMDLKVEKFATADLDTLVHVLHTRLNHDAARLKPAMRDSFRRHKNLFDGAEKAFDAVEKKYPFLKYSAHSIKPSLFSYLGNYLGFQGYHLNSNSIKF